MGAKPGRFAVIFRDYWSTILFFVSLASIVLIPFWLLTVPLGLVFTFRRVGMIHKVIADGIPVDAAITQKRYRKGEWIVRYQYAFDGNLYEAVNVVIGWNLYGMKVGDRLTAVVNPIKPTQAYLAKLYMKQQSPLSTEAQRPGGCVSNLWRVVFEGGAKLPLQKPPSTGLEQYPPRLFPPLLQDEIGDRQIHWGRHFQIRFFPRHDRYW